MTARLRVCHVVTRLELGGAQQNALYTAQHLDPARFEVLVATGPGGLLDQEAGASLPRLYFVPHLGRPIRPFDDMAALFELYRLFKREKPDIVHTHSSKAGVLGRIAAWLAGVPVRIHTFHGFGFHERQRAWVRWPYVLAEKFCARISSALIFVSNSNLSKARELRLGRPAKRFLIRSGIDLKAYPAKVDDPGKVKAALGTGMHKPLVLSVGNLKPQKNPEDFVLAARKVLEKVPDARFAFIGDGPLRARVEGLVLRENLHGKCLFPGWRRDVPQLMASADVFVLTSLWEGLPRALVEALRSGLPCVCYETDGVADLLQDGFNGFSTRLGDLDVLAKRVTDILKDPSLRRRLSEGASQSVGPEFDIEGMVRAQQRLYEELAAGRS